MAKDTGLGDGGFRSYTRYETGRAERWLRLFTSVHVCFTFVHVGSRQLTSVCVFRDELRVWEVGTPASFRHSRLLLQRSRVVDLSMLETGEVIVVQNLH